jgi:hypothetical protein
MKFFIFFTIVLSLSTIGRIALCVISGITIIHSDMARFSPLTGIGFALFAFGSLFISIGYCIMQSQHEAQMRKAIAEKSMKYSARIPIPCSWRLKTTRKPVYHV